MAAACRLSVWLGTSTPTAVGWRGRRAPVGRWLAIAALVAAIVTLVGLIVLWPRDEGPTLDDGELGFSEQVHGTVVLVADRPCSFATPDNVERCDQATIDITSGPTEGDRFDLEIPHGGGIQRLEEGDKIVLNYEPSAPLEARYQFADFQRSTPIWILAALFALAVIVFGRLRGRARVSGLVASILVLVVFMLPAILGGSSPLAVALVGSATIAFVGAVPRARVQRTDHRRPARHLRQPRADRRALVRVRRGIATSPAWPTSRRRSSNSRPARSTCAASCSPAS